VAWTYASTPGLTSAAELRDAVRLKIGDTNATDEQLSDSEIAFCLGGASVTTGTTATLLAAAIVGVKLILAKFARQVNSTRDGLSVSAGDRSQHYRDLLEDLYNEDEANQTSNDAVNVWAGGQSISEKVASQTDTDLVQPTFTIGMDDNPNTGSIPPSVVP
jgi:hypothetical protein